MKWEGRYDGLFQLTNLSSFPEILKNLRDISVWKASPRNGVEHWTSQICNRTCTTELWRALRGRAVCTDEGRGADGRDQ
jgi:hypothetical protein